MPSTPNLLNDDGTASMATMFMMSHHAFRRDLGRFAKALRNLGGDATRAQALREEWEKFRGALHGHHQVEDTSMFPSMREQHAELANVIAGLSADHHKIDPLLERGDAAFAKLPETGAALALVTELTQLLTPHLATEEAEIIPHIRAAKSFPAPPDDSMAGMYADGFAWSSHGVAPDILAKVYELLPPVVASRLPAALAAFEARCEKVWGSAKAGAARTPIPADEP
jgi:hypothetical protein